MQNVSYAIKSKLQNVLKLNNMYLYVAKIHTNESAILKMQNL